MQYLIVNFILLEIKIIIVFVKLLAAANFCILKLLFVFLAKIGTL
ncbi:hypothetical protein H4V97_000930 [Flavobacterium sp. CG_23.5]|nr:hypothetical protein [Flavobacterium sp. CG_23.5]